jgi:hypothetical protein
MAALCIRLAKLDIIHSLSGLNKDEFDMQIEGAEKVFRDFFSINCGLEQSALCHHLRRGRSEYLAMRGLRLRRIISVCAAREGWFIQTPGSMPDVACGVK